MLIFFQQDNQSKIVDLFIFMYHKIHDIINKTRVKHFMLLFTKTFNLEK